MSQHRDVQTKVTDSKSVEEELHKSIKQLKEIKFALDEAALVAITDRNGTITYANKKFCAVSEYTSNELIGQNHRILKSGFHPPEFFESMWKTISSGHTWHGNIKNVSKYGKYYWVKTTIVPLLDDDGKPEQYVAIRTEITDRKNAEEELHKSIKQLTSIEEITKTKDEFSAMITHELKTPLMPIMGYCKMFKTSMLGKLDQEQYEAIEIIEKNAQRLENLISDIMDARKIDLNKMALKIEDLPLDEFFSNLDSDYRKVLENNKCQFTTNVHIKNLVIKTDKSRLRQVFDNLISNAIKFIPDTNGKIDIVCMKEDNNLVFYVKDNGIGILKEKQKELFQKFYQIDTSERRSAGGAGLGLAISKGIVESLGGTISVESDGKTGTTFYIKFTI